MPAAPLYISSKLVSTDCGVAMTSPPPPGFADVPGEELAEMPEMLAKWQTVGAERTLAETDAERASPGYVLIEPGYRKPAYLINNDKEVVASFENDYFGFTQLQADGSRFSSRNMYSDVFMEGGGNRGCLEEYAADGSLAWRLRLATDDYIHHHDAVKLPNGNTLVNHGAKARVREVTPAGEIVWEYAYDDGAQGPHMLFRANRYPADHPAITAIINGDIR